MPRLFAPWRMSAHKKMSTDAPCSFLIYRFYIFIQYAAGKKPGSSEKSVMPFSCARSRKTA